MNNLSFRDGKEHLREITRKGTSMDVCATFSRSYICCRVHVLKSVQNCPFECSYCFLQNYLTDGVTKAVVDTETLMEEVHEKTAKHPQRLFRIGTWELGDSLALENKTGQAAALIQKFTGLRNAVLELKTKSDCIDAILSLDHGGRTVVSWSLNAEHIVQTEEHGTAPLQQRLKAMRKTAEAGYPVGVHFDPLILHNGWENNYRDLIAQLFDEIPPGRIAWISIGSLRFNPEMKKLIENNYPASRLTCAEMVTGNDAKTRYVKPVRVNMYRFIYCEMKKYLSPDNLVYLCMERWDVWDKVFGYHPDSAGHLDYLFAKSLYERYGLGSCRPGRKYYEEPYV